MNDTAVVRRVSLAAALSVAMAAAPRTHAQTGSAVCESAATLRDVRTSSPLIERNGDSLQFPASTHDPMAKPSPLFATLRYERDGSTYLFQYQSPGCAETIDLRTGQATLGCKRPRRARAIASDERAELTLDTLVDAGGFERTRIDLLDASRKCCLAPQCESADAPAVRIWARDDGHLVSVSTSDPIEIESHQIVLQLDHGELELATSRRGGGVYRFDQLIRVALNGQATLRNGKLLFSGDPANWAVDVYPRLNGNHGTELDFTLGRNSAQSRWTEIDGTYRHSENAGLQLRFDRAAPDPTYIDKRGLFNAMSKAAEQVFKTTMRYLRPEGALIDVSWTDEEIASGAVLSHGRYRRQANDEESLLTDQSEIEVVALSLDARYFSLSLQAPCHDDDSTFATINGYTFKSGADQVEPLPDAGLIVDGRVLGRIKTDPWYSNLIVDSKGLTWLENATRFFERRGYDASITFLLQGTTYVREGRNQRWDGDNPEVNWRSAIGIGRGPQAQKIILAHTLVPTTNLEALTAYGRGLTQFEMAQLMLKLGADDALVLDGGPSAAMRISGQLVSGGLRDLPLCIAAQKSH